MSSPRPRPVTRALACATALGTLLLVGCNGKDEGEHIPLAGQTAAADSSALPPGHPSTGAGAASALPDAARAALDSGNVYYSAGKYDQALASYRAAAKAAPAHQAPIFGVLMVANATKNKRLADSAQTALKAVGAPAAFTDSAVESVHKKGGAVTNPHPPAAPTTKTR